LRWDVSRHSKRSSGAGNPDQSHAVKADRSEVRTRKGELEDDERRHRETLAEYFAILREWSARSQTEDTSSESGKAQP